MSCYIVTFQAKELSTRQKIRQHLSTYDSYCAIHNTCWAVVTEKKAKEVRDEIGAITEPGDRLFIVRSGTEGAWRHVVGSTKTSDWLKRNL
jgi:hypothetical protein